MKEVHPAESENPLLAKLRKHPIFVAVAGYSVVAYAVLQGIGFFLGIYDVPHRIIQWLTVLATLGFGPVVLRSWQIDRHARGWSKFPQAPRGWLVLLLSAVLPAAAVVIFYRLHNPPPPPEPIPARSVAVLPFRNPPGDDKNGFIADGMQAEVLANLSKIVGLKVVHRARTAKGNAAQAVDLRETSKALGVAFVIEGSAERTGNNIHVTARLVDARTGAELWREKYDRDLVEMFVVPRDIAQAVATKIGASASPQERSAISTRPTTDEQAYLLYLEAVTHWIRLDQTDDLEAWYKNIIDLLQKATVRDPRFVEAFTLLTQVQSSYYRTFDLPPAAGDAAQRDAIAVANQRPGSVEANLAMGYYDDYVRHDFARAQAEFTEVVQREPNNANALFCLGTIARRQGRWDDASERLRSALEHDPDNNIFFMTYVQLLAGLHRYDDALTVLSRQITTHPHDPLLRFSKADGLLEWKADVQGARAAMDSLGQGFDPQGAVTLTRVDCDEFERNFDAAQRDLAACPLAELNGLPREVHEGYIAYHRGDMPTAKTAFEKALPTLQAQASQQNTSFDAVIRLAKVYAILGQKDAAAAERSRAKAMIPSDNNVESPAAKCELANALAMAGERDEAMSLLQEICGRPFGPHQGRLKVWPGWDPLRSDQRFAALGGAPVPKP